MKLILVSQRRDVFEDRNEIREALDVRLVKYLFSLGFLSIPVCSELAEKESYIEQLAQLKPDGILLSGGNDIGQASERDKIEILLLNYAKTNKLPVLGICRGMQMINHYFGGGLVNVKGHVASRHQLEGEWAKIRGYGHVNSYHNQAIVPKVLAKPLVALSTTADDVIEVLKHSTLPWFGVMWHPEREIVSDPADIKLISALFGGGL